MSANFSVLGGIAKFKPLQSNLFSLSVKTRWIIENNFNRACDVWEFSKPKSKREDREDILLMFKFPIIFI